jgi:hypothetical protein
MTWEGMNFSSNLALYLGSVTSGSLYPIFKVPQFQAVWECCLAAKYARKQQAFLCYWKTQRSPEIHLRNSAKNRTRSSGELHEKCNRTMRQKVLLQIRK